ncbi:hypothetical protein K4K58_002470 [Colletotrichum sp. SAR11_239]|nr:hypothetical protein K4K51_010096 [Colletotrichum sp. SAR 10_75]KAI8213813.1 hypothetical protein K4K52_003294 [Colletotrichum sp. SAR 10_76]KAI8259714.1 hypothetical protein K4K58_002470 [Colletotrichum sp. SAR11_239]KAJ5006974.1 hypothetical protein K4K48_001846 [Colletotrichum sp. SAR 10_66]
MLPLSTASQAEPAASPTPSETYSYSHDAAVAAITSYYELVARLQWDETSLAYPPPDGWPQITRESFASLGVTDAVIDVLRHIPYITDDSIEILENTHARCFIDSFLCDMIREDSEKQRSESQDLKELEEHNISDTGADEDGFPPGMILLAIGEEYGFKVYLDTTYGLIILTMNGGEFPRCEPRFEGDVVNPYVDWDAEDARERRKFENLGNIDDEEEDIFGDNDWKRSGKSEAFRIETFFDLCKEQWRRMNLMPRLECSGRLAMLLHPKPCSDEAVRQQILKNAGWPGSGPEIGMGWDKKKAKKDMIEYFGAWDYEDSD